MLGRSVFLAIAIAIAHYEVVSSAIIQGKDISGVKVSNVSPCSLKVSWTSDCTQKCNFKITYTGPLNGTASTQTNTTEIPGLTEGSYKICVVNATSKENVDPACATGSVAKEAPGKVQKVTFTKTPTNLTIMWTPATVNNCTADTKGLMLTLKKSANVSASQTTNVASTATNYTFEQLEPCTDYIASVEVMSDVANTTSGDITVSTSAEAPSKPGVSVTGVTPDTLHVTWNVTGVSSCNISNYIVKWTAADNSTSNITLGSDKREYSIGNLTESLKYTVSVTAVTTYENASISSQPSSMDISTCGPITSLKNSKQNACGFMLSWENTCSQSYNYTVTWEATPTNGSINTDKTSQSFQNLPIGSYNLCVDSTWNSTDLKCLNISIEKEAPEKVQNVTFVENSSLITVMWTPAKNYNCTATTIEYMVNLLNSQNITVNQTSNVPSNTTDYTFKKLVPCTEYIAKVGVLSEMANIYSEDKMVSTSAEAPSKPIVNVVDISPDSLLLNWTSTAVCNCNISNYIVQWWRASDNKTGSITLNSTQTEFSIGNLTDSSAYIVGATAVTTYKNTSLNSETALADLSTCGPVILFNQTKQNSCGFMLSWQSNCTQSYNYTVTWQGPINGSINTNKMSQNFENLPNGDYNLCVNSTWNSAEFNCLNTSIKQEAPGKVQNVTFAKNPRNLTVMWTPATNNNCTAVTKGFILNLYKSENASANQTISINVASNITNSTFKQLNPCSDYIVSVAVMSDVANTTSGNMTVSTSIEAPSKPAVTIVGISPTSLHVNWTATASPDTNCKISSYIVKWGVVASNTTNNMTVPSNSTWFTIANLTETSAYTISVTAVSTYENASLASEPSAMDVSACGPIIMLSKSKQNSCGFLLSWENNCTQKYNYTVTWKGALNGSIDTTKTNQSFPNLPIGSYNLCINSTWSSTDLMCLNASIVQEAPGNVQNVSFAKDSRTVTVSWSPANSYKCSAGTEGYAVTLQKSEKNSTKHITNVPSNSTACTFEKLEPCTEYMASVEVVSDVANTTSGNKTVSTSLEAPGVPKTTAVRRNSDTIIVQWDKPKTNSCPIDHYSVAWGIQHSDKDKSKNVTATSYTISGLKPQTTYSINVTAVVSYDNKTISSASKESLQTTGGVSSTFGNISFCNIVFIALLNICFASVLKC